MKTWWSKAGVMGFGAALAVGCASAPPPIEETKIRPQETLAPPPPASPALAANFDPKQLATQAVSPSECAGLAKDIRQQNAARGWAMLRACVERGKFTRGDFTDMRLILNDAWEEDLATQKDATLVISRIIAMRGGDIEGDLKQVQTRRVPLFTLAAAMKQPDTYKGRYVLIRAQMGEARGQGEKLVAELQEQTLRGVAKEAEVEGVRSSYASTRTGSVQADVRTTRYGNASGSASFSSETNSKSTKTNMRYENSASATGRTALGRLPEADPFLEPGKSYIFLARFDGVRQKPKAEDEDEKPASSVAVVSIVRYFPPAAMLVD